MSDGPSEADNPSADASNVLCISPEISPSKGECCRELLTRRGVPDRVIGVTVASSPGSLMAGWGDAINPRMTDISFIDVSHGGRSAAMSTDGFGGRSGAPIDVVKLPDVDLREIGKALTDRLAGANGETVVVCLDSLTDLLQFESRETLVRFLHVLTARIDEVGAVAHYHIDATGHPEEVFETFATLFDETVHPDSRAE